MLAAINISKTWKNIFSKLAVSDAIGNTRYNGTTVVGHQDVSNSTNTTLTDVSLRLGYQFIFISKLFIHTLCHCRLSSLAACTFR